MQVEAPVMTMLVKLFIWDNLLHAALCAPEADTRGPRRAAASGVRRLIASMTGYARAQGSDERRRWAWEARTVNGRNLEVRCPVPQGFARLGNPPPTPVCPPLKLG